MADAIVHPRRARQRSAAPSPVRGGCCTSTRHRRHSDFVGAHEDFGMPRVGRGPPPLTGGCCTSTRKLRSDAIRGAHEDICPDIPKPEPSMILEQPQRTNASSVAALPWRPSKRNFTTDRQTNATSTDATLLPRHESVGTQGALQPRPESNPELVQRADVPWRRRRAFNWEGAWREDRSQQVGMMELFEALEYPWHIRQIMKAAPGPSWLIKCVAQSPGAHHCFLN